MVKGINISTSGSLVIQGESAIPMTTIGAGLRRKKVLFATADVYVAQLLVSDADASKFVKTAEGALDSTDGMRAAAMHLSFVAISARNN